MLLLITHIIFTHVRFFLRRRRSFTSRKLHISVERFLCFFHQFGWAYVSSVRWIGLLLLLSLLAPRNYAVSKAPFTRVRTNLCTDKSLRGSTLHLHGTGGTGRIFERLKRPSHGKLKLANLCGQTQVGVCERHKNSRQTRWQTVGEK